MAVLLACASVGEARDVSFSEARQIARRLAPDVQMAAARASIAESEIAVAGTLSNPSFNVSTARLSARLSTSLSVPLPVFGQVATNVSAARADARAVGLDVNVVERDARWAATLAWVDLWESQARVTLLEQAASDAKQLLSVTREKFAAGSGPRLDVVRTAADSARVAAEAVAAERAVGAAAAQLALLIGAPADAELSAAGAPGYPPEAGQLETLSQRLTQHPQLDRDRAQLVAAEAHIEHEQRQRWPLVTPQVTLNQFDPTLPGTDVIVGIGFEVPLLNLRGPAIARAERERDLARTARALDEQSLRAELRAAYLRTAGASDKLRALRQEVLPAMQEAKEMTEEGFRSGHVDLIRVIEAQHALLESRVAEVDASAAWARAAADLERASGVDLEKAAAHAN
jgi:cobalt-zinc-cadmium efflux system outer membrane protein